MADGAGTRADLVTWRLLGANNRELGRSPIWYPGWDSCLEAVHVLRRDIGAVASAITAVAAPGGVWSWQLTVGGKPVAVASRPYHRHRECTYNLSHFVAAVPAARIMTEPCVLERR
ncbi:MAG TPA: hypothetical protein VFA06_10705 [Actinocrinis sp.]|uniref:hypothetical protein n=1 Tax=Actinocrinis sp. TaxID=1920516 RepID=UPI002D392FCC|nr:hypothetical protein [Actinocrinis sp.]HZU56328.1 hypothetical protein [Actinocrinis sp.]